MGTQKDFTHLLVEFTLLIQLGEAEKARDSAREIFLREEFKLLSPKTQDKIRKFMRIPEGK